MIIRIAYHAMSETLANRISQILQENGIATNVESQNGEVSLTVEASEEETKRAEELLESTFVHVETTPGY